MTPARRTPISPAAAKVLLLLASLLILNCNTWARIGSSAALQAAPPLPDATRLAGTSGELRPAAAPTQTLPAARPAPATTPVGSPTPEPPVPLDAPPQPVSAGEPAGCLSVSAQDALPDTQAMLTYAATLVDLQTSFEARLLPNTWNGFTGLFTWKEFDVLSISVSDVRNTFLIQRMLNALHVAGFVAWLRDSEAQGLHILAIPLRDPALMQSAWAPYVEAYWRSRASLPAGDADVLPTLKLPPCAWMVARGFAPPVGMEWWSSDRTGWPDYAVPAAAYLAGTTTAAEGVARAIDWLGEAFPEGPTTMCGPLVWSIMNDAGVFPPGWGEWLAGPKTFWLAKPEENGRPWSLFPKESYEVFRFSQPLGSFDFRTFPLYPGDFLYTYAYKDGFEHMLLVTEVNSFGDVYTVTNLISVEPESKVTIERTLLLNLNDPSLGIARNQWAQDKINGRTGHAGFEVFRWAWMQKDITAAPVAEFVQPGDTFGLLAARWKTPAAAIAEYNGLTVDAPLTVGQVVLIPPNRQAQIVEE